MPKNGPGTTMRALVRGREAAGFHGTNSGSIHSEGVMNGGAPVDLGDLAQAPGGSLMRDVGITQGQQRAGQITGQEIPVT